MTEQANTINIFEAAVRQKLRFETGRGMVSVEELWGFDLLPNKSGTNINLDDIGKAIRSELKEFDTEGESLVESATANKKTTAARKKLQLSFDVVKHVINVLVAEDKARKAKASARQERETLLELLESAERNEKASMTPDQIREKLAQLSAGDDE